jgi:hypothetical protein
MRRKDLTQEKLKSCLDYDPSTGEFTYLPKDRSCFNSKSTYTMYNKYMVGTKVKGTISDGYVRIKIEGKSYLAHSLAILFMDGYYPELVDHINHNKTDNRYANLNPTTAKNNSQNRPTQKNNKSGHPGVGKVIRKGVWNNKWYACIEVDGKKISKNNFITKEEAITYRQKLKEQYHQYVKEIDQKMNRSSKRKMKFKSSTRKTLSDFMVKDEKPPNKKNTKNN